MATTLDETTSESAAADINTSIGVNHELRFYDGTDTLLSTCTFSGSGVVSTTGSPTTITFAHGSYTDDTSPTAGTISYATLHRTAATAREVVRFSDPLNDISLSSTTIPSGATMDVNTDIVIQLPANTA